MFDKYVRNVRAVSAMAQQVNVRREIRAWIKQHSSATAAATTTAAKLLADRSLPEYVMHKGHPRYGETKEVEEKHEHEGITDDEEESEGADDDDDEDDDEGDDEDEDDNEDDEDEEDDDEDEDDEKQAQRRQRGKRHRRRKGGADELDESEDEKTEERIVAEKVLRVFINKTIGLVEPAASSSDPSVSAAAVPPVDLISPTSATLTTPLPASALLPVDPSALGDGSPLDADEEQAAKAIVSTRDGRNAFATIFSSLSPNFHASQLPKSLFFSFTPDPLAGAPLGSVTAASSPPPVHRSLTLSRASFNALGALTSLFLDAAHTTYHIEPAIFVANVAHQIVREPASHSATSTTTPNTSASTQPTTVPAMSPSDDVMRKEEVEADSGAKHMTLLATLSLHPLLKDSRFYSTALFASLHHAFAHSSLYLHRWYSDEEQEDVERRRETETVSMISRYERLMRDCGVKRRERRKFVEKQVRVFDLLGKDAWKEAVLELTKRNERGAQQAEDDEEDDEDEREEEDSPLSIEGLREVDSEEERQSTLLKRKEEERRAMAEQKLQEKRKKKTAEADLGDGATKPPVSVTGRKKREEEERKKREDEEKERKRVEDDRRKHEEKKKPSASSFLAHSISSLQSSWFAHRSHSPTPAPATDPAARDRKSSGATAPVAATPAGSAGVRIPIPVAAAVPPPAHISPGAAAKAVAPAAGKAAVASVVAGAAASQTRRAETSATIDGKAEGGAAKKKRVIRRKKKPLPDSTAATTTVQPAAPPRTDPNVQANDVDDMP